MTQNENPPLKVLVTGASGFVGSALVACLRERGDTVVTVSRDAKKGDVLWDVAKGEFDVSAAEGCDVFVHLAGESVAQRWTRRVRQQLWDSRVKSTALLVRSIEKMNKPPATFLCASAIGYYGFETKGRVDESSPLGSGYLAEICQAWEEATKPLDDSSVRVVNTRIGLVLGQKGGALQKMLPAFRMGAGGPIGNGKQMMSWITIDDIVSGMLFCLENASMRGPVNFVAPNAVSNEVFSKTLGTVLNRPAIVRAPAIALKLAMGEMAKETLLADCHVYPQRLLDAGYAFKDVELEDALKRLLNES